MPELSAIPSTFDRLVLADENSVAVLIFLAAETGEEVRITVPIADLAQIERSIGEAKKRRN